MTTGRTPQPPTIQRLPPRTEEGKQLAKSFREFGAKLADLDIDFAAIELRILADQGKKP